MTKLVYVAQTQIRVVEKEPSRLTPFDVFFQYAHHISPNMPHIFASVETIFFFDALYTFVITMLIEKLIVLFGVVFQKRLHH